MSTNATHGQPHTDRSMNMTELTNDQSLDTTDWARTLFRWARLAIWDVFRALVAIPATIVATPILVLALLGGNPVDNMLTTFYESRDNVGDIAGDGLISWPVCQDDKTDRRIQDKPIPCTDWATESKPIATVVSETKRSLGMLYITLVMVSFFLLYPLGAWGRYTQIQTTGLKK